MEIEKIYGDLPILETERLILRKVTLEDLEDMFVYGSNEEVSKYVTWNTHKTLSKYVTWNTHKTLSDTKDFVEFVLNKYKNKQVAPWGIQYEGKWKTHWHY
jgi:[ribosomal protein S5]-alanine N-acetyltransferase